MADYQVITPNFQPSSVFPGFIELLDLSVPPTSQAESKHVLYIGTYGHVVAFDLTRPHEKPARLWNLDLVGAGYGPASVLYEGGILYAACGGCVFKINASSGKIIWRSNASSGWILLTMLSKGQVLLVAGGNHVCAFSKDSGQIAWNANLGLRANCATTMALVDDVLYVGSFGNLFALDVKSGSQFWTDGLSGRGYSPLTVHYSTSSQGQPTLYVGGNGYITSFIASKDYRKEVKCVNLGGYTNVSSLVLGGSLVLGNKGVITCVDSATLETKWSNGLSGTGFGMGTSLAAVESFGKQFVIAGNNGYLTAVSAKDGATVWSTSLPGSGYRIVSVIERSGVLIAGSKGMLYGLDVATGKILWSDNLSGLGFGNMLFADSLGSTDTHASQPIMQEEALVRRAAAAAAASGH